MWNSIADHGKDNSQQPYKNTISACMDKAHYNGYVDHFEVHDRRMVASSNGRLFSPGEVNVINLYRFECQSNPAENAVMYVIETDDGQKGTLLDSSGTNPDEHTNRFMTEVDHLHRRGPAGPQL